MLNVFFSELSIANLEEVRDYIAPENRDAPIQLLDDIEAPCERPIHSPRIRTQRDDLLPGIRLFPVRKIYAVV
jgi:plasmid stabilization system protein ParE